MTFEEYIPLALRTEVERPYNERLLHCAMGLVTESVEMLQSIQELDQGEKSNLKEEIGDVFWYLAIGWSALKKDPTSKSISHVLKCEDNPERLCLASIACSSYILDTVKKLFFYKKKEVDIGSFANDLSAVSAFTKAVAVVFDVSISDCLEANIAKLKVRYPDKFTSEAAINRNLDAEKEALS